MVNTINCNHAVSFNNQNHQWMQISPRSSIFGMVADTARKRTWARELDFNSGFWASIFILLTIASKTAPRGSFNRWTSSISRSAISLKKLIPPSFARYLVTASNFYLKKKKIHLVMLLCTVIKAHFLKKWDNWEWNRFIKDLYTWNYIEAYVCKYEPNGSQDPQGWIGIKLRRLERRDQKRMQVDTG